MAKEVAISKRAKINEAQKIMLVGVFGASLVIGAALVLVIYFIRYIAFNSKVIGEKDAAIVTYSNAIADSGTCKKPKGKTYTTEELKQCSPNDIEAEEVAGTLRYNVLVDMASNLNLESVARDSLSVCVNSENGEKYTYAEINEKYDNATNSEERSYYLGMLKLCSALRVIPDALPTVNNEEALMASLNKIFIVSQWEPESLSPSGNGGSTDIAGLYAMPLNLSIDAQIDTTLRVLNNIEKSIREFSITNAAIEWSGELDGADQLTLTAQATAYYADPVEYNEIQKTVYANNKKKGKTAK